MGMISQVLVLAILGLVAMYLYQKVTGKRA